MDETTLTPSVETARQNVTIQTMRCKYCGSEITSGALLCPVCKSYQSRLRNTLTYIGGLTGIMALVISGLTFTYSKISDMIAARQWHDKVSVVYMRYPGDINSRFNGEMLVTNSGDGDVYVSTLSYDLNTDEIEVNNEIPLDADVIKKGSVSKMLLPYRSDPLYGDMNRKADVVIYIKSGHAPGKLVLAAFDGSTDRCVFPYFTTRADPTFKRMNASYKMANHAEVAVVPVRAHLDVMSIR
jgi:hypothetical protein